MCALRDFRREHIIATLLHEMCHYFNYVNGINDTNGNKHNKKFKKLAESVGLVVEKGKSVGYGYTSLSDELKDYVETRRACISCMPTRIQCVSYVGIGLSYIVVGIPVKNARLVLLIWLGSHRTWSALSDPALQ